MAAPQEGDSGLLIRPAQASQGQGRHRMAAIDQGLTQEGAGEILPMAVAEQQDRSHSPHPGGAHRRG